MTLAAAIVELEGTMQRFPSAAPYKLPDLILYNLAIDVAEHALAVEELCAGRVPRAGVANARAALESAIDLAYLVSDQVEYPRRGARARVYEAFEIERIQRRADLISVMLPGASEDLEHSLKTDAADWDAEAPGQGRLVISAFEYFCRNPASVGEHWSGHTRLELYRQLAADDPSVASFVQQLDVVYALLSVSAHPRPRSGQRQMTPVAPDRVVFSPLPGDCKTAQDVAAIAVRIANGSLERRRAWVVPTA